MTKKRVSKRVVNSKRHTTHYVIGGKTVSVSEATTMARKGLLAGVRVVGNHIQSAIGCRPLSKLPTVRT
jgi:hypothetical protein